MGGAAAAGHRDAGEPIIAVEGLVKRYPECPVNAMDGISFSVARGEVFGLLGPKEPGKTTTIGILTTRAWLTGADSAGEPDLPRRLLQDRQG